jgi:two-component system phosphate regulon response regulator PhoB
VSHPTNPERDAHDHREEAERVLVVDAEEDARNLVAFNVRQAGFTVDTAGNGRDGITAARALQPTVVVLEQMLPDMLGTAVCGLLRHDPRLNEVGILMLTARGSAADRIHGLEAGADDYMVKPFHVREVVLRVRSLAKRARDSRIARASEGAHRTLKWGDIEIEPARHRVAIGGQPVSLRPLELRLLVTFVASPGTLFTRADLMRDVWGAEGESDSRTVDTHVRRLRERLGTRGHALETAHGLGYRWREDPGPAVL